jgi:protein O-GlcNAc transferase
MNSIETARAKFLKGVACLEQQSFASAEKLFIDTLQLAPRSIPTLINLAIVQHEQNKIADAEETAQKAIAIDPKNVEAYSMLSTCLKERGKYEEALATCEMLLEIDKANAEAHCNRGYILHELGRRDEAIESFDHALIYQPEFHAAFLNRGNSLLGLKRYEEALAAYDKALALKPDLEGAEGARLHSKMHLCDWSNFDAECAHLISSVRKGKLNTKPFAILPIPSSAQDQLQCAKLSIAHAGLPSDKAIRKDERCNHERIRLAYLSADFRDHPVSSLIAGVFECHDKSRFAITAISFGSDDNSEMRRQLKQTFGTQFIDVKTWNDTQVAGLVKEAEIDILVDLMGFTGDSRKGIFARRSAPIQVNYLGYPGTMGAEYIDYIIADKTVIPETQRRFYTEKIVELPNSFQPTDRERRVSDKKVTRAEVGLPQKDFVFCCFNSSYKITPDVYDIWMRLLKQVDGSVLWLAANSPTVAGNLRREAAIRGVNAERLIFAPIVPLPEYQARLHLADLFLDTSPYNAGATASDALWAGLPVLTRIGDTFVGRMAASVLNAIGLPEQITATAEAYEALAIDLAANRQKLETIKQKLANNRLKTPLFDTKLYTKHLEAAYTAMYERFQSGLEPDHIIMHG